MSRAAPTGETRPVRTPLFDSLDIAVVDFRCRAHVEPYGPEEVNSTHSIALVRRGVFTRLHRGEALLADANHVLFFNAAEEYRYGHPVDGGDDCTVLALQTSRALELVTRHAPWEAHGPERPFGLGHGLSSPRAVWLHWELLRLFSRPTAERLTLDDLLVELADEAVRSAYAARGARMHSPRESPAARRRRRELVEAAKLALAAARAAPPSLAQLARALDCSPFHLSRVFHATAGLSLRRYVGRLRARVAAERLSRGAADLTALALDLGYADHSHFTNSFRQEWGVAPSRFRGSHDRRPPGQTAG